MTPRKFAQILVVVAAAVSFLPYLYGILLAPSGSWYVGSQWGTDDQMVYAAWMHQASGGHFLFDNRFAVDPQPGLTIHLYFFVLGLISKLFGIALTQALARAGFTGLFVWLVFRFIEKVTDDPVAQKLALGLTLIGGGVGFLVWHTYGLDIVRPAPEVLKSLLNSHLPTDVWQPEGFVFPSLLTNSLFMVSLCLIMGIFHFVLLARDSWKPVGYGALCFFVLMNIHSYDILLVALVLVGLLASAAMQKTLTKDWLLRVVVMGLGALPSALWFMYVLKHDAVFQARAETLTFSPTFRQVAFGYLPLLAMAIGGFFAQGKRVAWLAVALVVGMFVLAGSDPGSYWMGMAVWAPLMIAAWVICGANSRPNMAWSLAACWALVGLVAPYFPALFQRKLLMGLSIPLAILGAVALADWLKNLKGMVKPALGIGVFVLSGMSSLLWLKRDFGLVQNNLSNTTTNSVYLPDEAGTVLAELSKVSGERHVLLALPGFGQSTGVDQFSPGWPDLNPIMSGLTGIYSYAGHWSETPHYKERRNQATEFFLSKTSDDKRMQIIKESGADYLLGPTPAPGLFTDIARFGQVVAGGKDLVLVKVRN